LAALGELSGFIFNRKGRKGTQSFFNLYVNNISIVLILSLRRLANLAVYL